jgi:PEP-CTERM motif
VKTTAKFSARMLGVTVVLSGLTFLANGSNVLGAVPSDELVVTPPAGGPPAADIVIPETAGAGTQPSALFAPTTTLTGLVPPGGLAALIPPAGVPGASFVIFAEPPGEPIDPTALPPVTFSGPNGSVIVSDLLVSGFANPNTPFIALVSDNNPDLAAILSKIPPTAPVPILPETGLLEDVSGLIGATFPGFGVQVRSDVSVPEPSSIVILLGFVGMGLIGLTWHRHRTA